MLGKRPVDCSGRTRKDGVRLDPGRAKRGAVPGALRTLQLMLLSLGSILTVKIEALFRSAGEGDPVVAEDCVLKRPRLARQGAGIAEDGLFIRKDEGSHPLTSVEPLAEVIHGFTRSLQYV